MRYAPRKVFILEDGKYIEIAYEDLLEIIEQQEEKRYFLPLHGMLMEVSEETYYDFYKEQRRQKYLKEESLRNGEISYDMFTTETFEGKEILVDRDADTEQVVEKKIMLDKLYEAVEMLEAEEKEVIKAIFFDNMTVREYAKRKGVCHNVVQKKKKRAVEKLRCLINK